ncbi:haloacid dehalogenase superfamily, subfamily IA, variant 3 with third motif having DD or ED/haloacid dehalogenase superfamily, subfamily IA, variant 1 with third motif having Dx(3-4)D or Dx(3-4)E [Leifsonia sp. 21MFCrub1.1]|nr:haloacid dehalogenase superfamily, subfamily IA, variant 3 with third motif having DD or ED/haloacid dehalogenase superfamily, subfamily IA, variant 1 with third motif having Dx(3-4)D or Dx(3-4)E [Leifsonia sp. 21MFCrub1.1]
MLFDVDGTLVDSNFLHVDAWSRAFADMDTPVDSWRIHRAIGQDSAKLLEELVGDRDDDWSGRAKDLHSRYYREQAGRLRAFDEAADLLRELSSRGIRVVLATSAPEDELELLMDVLDAGDAVHATTNADDVATAKPEPGIIEVALERAGSAPSDALFIGDSVWDMMAAARAHVRSAGLLSGGVGPSELLEAGAVSVFDDPADLLARIDGVLSGRRSA